MGEDLLRFVIDGGDARGGNVSADVFAARFKDLLAAIYAFDRAYSGEAQRQLDLEIVDLSRRSPAQVAMRPRARAQGYDAREALAWSCDQLDRLRRGDPLSERVQESALASVISLADFRQPKVQEVSLMRIEYGGRAIALDKTLAGQATIAREHLAAKADDTRWHAGVSYGSLSGELRGVVDLDGERQFYIAPPSGPARVQCVFDEAMRAQMVENLFKSVRASGYLHYDGKTPFPSLMEAKTLDGVKAPELHISDLFGAFPGLDRDDFTIEAI